MSTSRRQARTLAILGFSLAAILSPCLAPPAQAGPISEMLARHRQNRQMKLPPMDPPFSKKPIKDLSIQQAGFATRLKKRFSLHRTPSSGVIPFQDSNVNKASN